MESGVRPLSPLAWDRSIPANQTFHHTPHTSHQSQIRLNEMSSRSTSGTHQKPYIRLVGHPHEDACKRFSLVLKSRQVFWAMSILNSKRGFRVISGALMLESAIPRAQVQYELYYEVVTGA